MRMRWDAVSETAGAFGKAENEILKDITPRTHGLAKKHVYTT